MRLSVQYAISTLGKTIPFAAADAFSLYFYTDVVGIPPALAGTMVLAILSWSAICDPLAGWIYQSRMVRRLGPKPYFAWGVTAMTALFVLSFFKPPSGSFLWLFLLAAAMLFRFAYALTDVPHNALISSLQRRGQSPARLGAMRLSATIAGTLITVFAARYALDAPTSAAAGRFTALALATGVTGALLFFGFLPFTAIGASEIAAILPAPPQHERRQNAWTACAAFFISAVAATIINGMFSKDIVYIAKYVLHNPGWSVTGLVLFTVGKILGVPCWVMVSERAGSVRTMQASFALIAAVGIGIAIAPPHFSYLGTGLFFFGMGIAGTNIAGWALMPACAELFKSGWEPVVFGAFTAVNKIASGLSGAIIAYTLSALGLGSRPISHAFQIKSLYWLVYVYPIAAAAMGITAIAVYGICSTGVSPDLAGFKSGLKRSQRMCPKRVVGRAKV